MGKNLKETFKSELCCYCINSNCKNNILYEKQDKIVSVHCPDYKREPYKVSKQKKRQERILQNYKTLYISYLIR